MNKFTMEQTMTVLMTMDLPRDRKLALHLSQHFEVPRNGLFRACKQAILLDSYGFDWDATEIELPEYISFMGQTKSKMRNIIEINHLQWFLKDTEDNGRLMSEPTFSIDLAAQGKEATQNKDAEKSEEWE